MIGWGAPEETREDVIWAFARLQIEALPNVDHLLGAGCLDRLRKLLAELGLATDEPGAAAAAVPAG